MSLPSSTPAQYSHELVVAEEAARVAGEFIRAQAENVGGLAIHDKGIHDLVTFVDEEAERIVKKCIQTAFPDDEVLGEETAGEDIQPLVEGRRWIVDPLDGTTNFIHSVPPYAVSIALQDGSDMVAGIVYDVSHDELFSAEIAQGLTLNGKSAYVSETADLEGALLATGFPFRDYGYLDGYVETLAHFMRSTRGIRRAGAAAVDLAWVACGRFDGFFEAGLAPWDMAAGVVLVQAAGGLVSGLPNGSDPVFEGGIVATNKTLHEVIRVGSEPLGCAYGASRGIRPAASADRRDERLH